MFTFEVSHKTTHTCPLKGKYLRMNGAHNVAIFIDVNVGLKDLSLSIGLTGCVQVDICFPIQTYVPFPRKVLHSFE